MDVDVWNISIAAGIAGIGIPLYSDEGLTSETSVK
jgi:hypothetical protein